MVDYLFIYFVQPQLAKAVEDTTKLEEAIAKNSKVVSDFWKVVHAEEMAVSAKGSETAYLEAEAQKAQEALDAHVPVVAAALAAVRALSKPELLEFRALLPIPPDRILRVLEAICLLKDIKPSQEEIKRLLLDPPELDWFANFDKNQISVVRPSHPSLPFPPPSSFPLSSLPTPSVLNCTGIVNEQKDSTYLYFMCLGNRKSKTN